MYPKNTKWTNATHEEVLTLEWMLSYKLQIIRFMAFRGEQVSPQVIFYNIFYALCHYSAIYRFLIYTGQMEHYTKRYSYWSES